MIGKARANPTYFTRSGDVDDVWTEPFKHLPHLRNVPRKNGIEAQILLKCKGEKTARKFEGLQVIFFRKGMSAISSAHAEKRKIATARECLKVAAGVRNAVYLVERIRKIGNAGSGA